MKCFFHSADLDGHCSGFLVKIAHPSCEMVGIDYGEAFPWNTLIKEDRVFMVDFSIQPFEGMLRLKDMVDLTWIDHHKSAIEEHNKTPHAITGLRECGKAACELTWDYFHNRRPTPLPFYLIGRYDVWDHTHPKTLPFQYGCRMHETSPDKQEGLQFWFHVYDNDDYFNSVLNEGEVVLKYIKQANAKLVKARSFEATVDGLKFIVCNAGLANSQLFDSVFDTDKHDAMMTFCMLPSGRWTISMYSTKDNIDLGTLAKAKGGGGHKGAAGFQCDELPFTFPFERRKGEQE